MLRDSTKTTAGIEVPKQDLELTTNTLVCDQSISTLETLTTQRTTEIKNSSTVLQPDKNPTDVILKQGLNQAAFWSKQAKNKVQFKVPFNLEKLAEFLGPIGKNANILDIGCGYGRVLNILHDAGYNNINGIDFAEEMIKEGVGKYDHLKQKLHLVTDGSQSKFPDHSMDVVILFSVLTCNKDYDAQNRIIKEAERVLKPNGLLYLNDYYLSSESKFQEIYKKSVSVFGEIGVFGLSGGGICRHSKPEWFERLLSNFSLKWDNPKAFTSDNGSQSFQFIGCYNFKPEVTGRKSMSAEERSESTSKIKM